MQKKNPGSNSVRQIKYKFAERSHNFLMQSLMQLMSNGLWELDKLQICVKGNSTLEFRSVSMGIRNMEKIATEQKKYQKIVWPRHPLACLERICLFD